MMRLPFRLPTWRRILMKQSQTVRSAFRTPRLRLGRLTSPLRPLPGFLIIGGQRCGTTSLYYYLRGHPDVMPALGKEIQFFSTHWSRGEGWYRAHFPLQIPVVGRHRPAPTTFEATPYYLFHPLAAARAAEVVGGAKLLVLLRDPVERAWSHYRHMVRLGLEPLSFQEAIEREPERLSGEVERIRADPRYDAVNHRRYSYLARGRYAEQLEGWLRHFAPDRLLILRSEALFHDTARCYRDVLSFLGLRQWTPPSFPIHTRQSPLPRGMPAEMRRRLDEHFAPANQRLEGLLRRIGTDVSLARPVAPTL
jgi:Sulfotransferase domain